jgi:hypothetical protein
MEVQSPKVKKAAASLRRWYLRQLAVIPCSRQTRFSGSTRLWTRIIGVLSRSVFRFLNRSILTASANGIDPHRRLYQRDPWLRASPTVVYAGATRALHVHHRSAGQDIGLSPQSVPRAGEHFAYRPETSQSFPFRPGLWIPDALSKVQSYLAHDPKAPVWPVRSALRKETGPGWDRMGYHLQNGLPVMDLTRMATQVSPRY